MRNKSEFLLRSLLVPCFLALAGAGCFTSTHTAPSVKRMPDVTAGEKVPLRLGLYMQPQVRDYTTVSSNLRLKPGRSLGEGVERLMRSVFTDVFLLSSLRAAAQADLDAVMTVEILSGDFKLGGMTSNSVYDIQVQYTVTDATGRLLWSEAIESTGKKAFNILKREYPDAMREAIEDNLDKTWEAMRESRWWKPRPEKSGTDSE